MRLGHSKLWTLEEMKNRQDLIVFKMYKGFTKDIK